MDQYLTEIRIFQSLKEIRESTEQHITQCRLLLEDYSQRLGSLLRNPESNKDTDRAKKTAELQKVLKTGSGKSSKKDDKKSATSTDWVQFKDMLLCAEPLGEAEILFEAVEELKAKIDRLEKAKNSIVELEKHGVGKDLFYVTYMRDGIPERVFFKPKNEADLATRFQYTADFQVTAQANEQ